MLPLYTFKRRHTIARENSSSILLLGSIRDHVLHDMEDCLPGKLSLDIQDRKNISLTSSFVICIVILASMCGAFQINVHKL
jgi:hypothetical protein